MPEIIFCRVRGNRVFMGGVIIISIKDHPKLQPVSVKPFLLSSHFITRYKMMKLETTARAFGDMSFPRL